MSKSNSFEIDHLKLIFQNAGIAGVGDSSGLLPSGLSGNLYVRLYTSAIAVDDSTIGTECSYTGYVAKGVAVPRSSAGWTVANNSAKNAALITFVQCQSNPETVRYFAIWKNNTSNSEVDRLYWGTLTNDLVMSINTIPEFGINDLVVNED